MKKKHQVYFRLNIMSLLLITVSFISVTLAWFAYSGLATVDTTVDINAWYIELEKDGEKVSNNIVISLSDIYPGMETKIELINVKNQGDSDAELKYNINNARILGDISNNYSSSDVTSTEEIEDILSHEFPFNININLNKRYILAKGDESVFEISVSWPLDSGDDELDSIWGSKAYKFQLDEAAKKKDDPNYQIESSIKIKIDLTAEQYLANAESSDPDYNLGDEILIDVVNNKRCDAISETCIKMYVMDSNNTLGDSSVTLLTNPFITFESSSYYEYNNTFNNITNSWNVKTRPLSANDLLNVISNDVEDSLIIRDNLSDVIIGNLKYNDRISKNISKVTKDLGYYRFSSEKFLYLTSAVCYWTESNYNENQAFALIKVNDDESKIYNENKSNICKVLPIVEMNKIDL